MNIRKQIILLLVSCVFLNCYGQREISKEDKTYSMEINSKEFVEKISIARNNREKNKKCKPLWYFWYLNNAVHFSEGGYSGKLLNGAYTSYYKSMNLRSSGTFRYGLMHGEWNMWFESGAMKSTEQWKNGVKNGTCVYFSEDGISKKTEDYRRGIINGKQKIYCNDSLVEVHKFRDGKEIIKKLKIKTESPKDTLPQKSISTNQRTDAVTPENRKTKEKNDKGKNIKKEKPKDNIINKENAGIRQWPFGSKKDSE